MRVGPPIALWAVPRSRSTAFLRIMIERGDLDVLHEPFSYLSDEGGYEVAGRRRTSMPDLLGALLEGSDGDKRVFFKDTSDYRYDVLLADDRLYRGVVNTFLIRQPRDVVASHYAMNPEVTLDQIGFEYLHTMFEAVRGATRQTPLVIDGDDLVGDPEGTMRGYCERVGLEFIPDALRWRPGSQPVWQRTGRWHRDVDRSSGLTADSRRHRVHPEDDPRLRRLVDHHQPYYDALYAHRLLPGGI